MDPIDIIIINKNGCKDKQSKAICQVYNNIYLTFTANISSLKID